MSKFHLLMTFKWKKNLRANMTSPWTSKYSTYQPPHESNSKIWCQWLACQRHIKQLTDSWQKCKMWKTTYKIIDQFPTRKCQSSCTQWIKHISEVSLGNLISNYVSRNWRFFAISVSVQIHNAYTKGTHTEKVNDKTVTLFELSALLIKIRVCFVNLLEIF